VGDSKRRLQQMLQIIYANSTGWFAFTENH